MFEKIKKYSKALWILLVAIFLFNVSTYVVYQGEYAITRQFGKVVNIVDEPGLKMKIPFIQSVSILPNKTLIYDLETSDVITKDKQTMVSDCFVLWRITNPQKFIQSLNGSIINAESRIEALAYNAMKEVISSSIQADVISGRDGKLAENIKNTALKTTDTEKEYGIEILSIETKHLDLPYDNKTSVYNRMISERTNIAAGYLAEGKSEAQKIKNETDKEVSIMLSNANKEAELLLAEGEAEYMRIMSEAYNNASKANFYEFVRGLEAIETSIANEENVIILDKDSPIAKIFYKTN